MNPNVLVYVRQAFGHGKSEGEVRDKLKGLGLSDAEISQAINQVHSEYNSVLGQSNSIPKETVTFETSGSIEEIAAGGKTSNQRMSVNPWISIWYQPRRTIREIINLNPKYMFHPLIILGGISWMLDILSMVEVGQFTSSLLHVIILALFLGPLLAYINITIAPIVLHIFGKFVGGKGTPETIRVSYVWGFLPTVVLLFVYWIPNLLIFDINLFLPGELPLLEQLPLRVIALPIVLLTFVIDIMLMVIGPIIRLKLLAEAQEFSFWRAILNALPLILMSLSSIARF
jgi:hypothetical protein